MKTLRPEQETFLLIMIAQIAEMERINVFRCRDAVNSVCDFYEQPVEETALDLYFWLRAGEREANRAMVHQFREHLRAQQ